MRAWLGPALPARSHDCSKVSFSKVPVLLQVTRLSSERPIHGSHE